MDLKNPIRLYAVLFSREEMERVLASVPKVALATSNIEEVLAGAREKERVKTVAS